MTSTRHSPPLRLRTRVTDKAAPVTVKKVPDGIVPDPVWPGMYRLVLPDGRLSDMVNLTRAKDALRHG